MKKMLAAFCCMAMITVNISAGCFASGLVGVSGDEAAEPQKAIGEKTENAVVCDLKNATGKDIKAFSVKTGAAEEYTENLLAEADVFADGETRTFFFAPYTEADSEASAEEQSEASEEIQSEASEEASEEAQSGESAQAETELPDEQETLLFIQLTFADDTEAEIHVFDVKELEAAQICLEAETAYLVYEDESGEVRTLEREQQLAKETEQEETPDDDVVLYDDYEDVYYDDSAYYDDSSYYDNSGADDGAAQENCLEGGLMN